MWDFATECFLYMYLLGNNNNVILYLSIIIGSFVCLFRVYFSYLNLDFFLHPVH